MRSIFVLLLLIMFPHIHAMYWEHLPAPIRSIIAHYCIENANSYEDLKLRAWLFRRINKACKELIDAEEMQNKINHRIETFVVMQCATQNEQESLKKDPLRIKMIKAIECTMNRYIMQHQQELMKDQKREAFLHFAAKYDNVFVVRFLLTKGMSVNTSYGDCTPLGTAILYNSQKVFDILLGTKGCNTHCADFGGLTPLHIAVTRTGNNAESMVHALVDHSTCVVNQKNNMGNTPLHLARIYGKKNIAAILIEHGAREDIVNSLDMKPKDYDI